MSKGRMTGKWEGEGASLHEDKMSKRQSDGTQVRDGWSE